MHEKVARALAATNTPFKAWRHDAFAVRIAGPADFAAALGYSVERVTKSLFLSDSGRPEQYAVVVLPITKSLDMVAVATQLGWTRARVASREALTAHLGYPPFGVSPLGVQNIPVLMDTSLLKHPTVLVGGGEAGVEIEIAPLLLREVTSAIALDLAA